MSYKPDFPKNMDSISQLFSTMNDCMMACRQMLKNTDNTENFARWFDKARLIDSRTTYFFIRKHWDEIPDDCKDMCMFLIKSMDMNKILMLKRLNNNPEAIKRGFDYRKAIIKSKIVY
jgi:hypothetical protein